MKSENYKNLPESIRQRLRSLAKEQRRPGADLLQYYAMERFLYRLSKSPYVDRLILKGGLMLNVFGGTLSRGTKDIDFLSRAKNDVDDVAKAIKSCFDVIHEDGVEFDADSLRMMRIQFDAQEPGIQVTFVAKVGASRVNMKVDIGFGSPVVPHPLWVIYPELLDFGAPRLLGYSAETMIADKFEAMVSRDETNSRLKDFYDIWVLSQVKEFDGKLLQTAVNSTFQFYKTAVPSKVPLCLTPEFFERTDKLSQWRAFFRNAKITTELSLDQATKRIEILLMPICNAIHAEEIHGSRWRPGGPWLGLD